jgi:hypothetical protein
VAQSLGRELALPEIGRCAVGPQGQRVEALDQLGARLLLGPKSPASNAILGFAASLVDPGAPILPELLRRYSDQLPSAALWLGAFAGMWFPVRALSEHAGLGRLIGKELLAQSDLFSKPRSDISFEELSRWTGGTFTGRTPLRGLLHRVLFVELVPGVAIPTPAVRGDSSRGESASSSNPQGRQQAFQLTPPLEADGPARKVVKSGAESLRRDDILSRLEKLEKIVAELSRTSTRNASRQGGQRGGKPKA